MSLFSVWEASWDMRSPIQFQKVTAGVNDFEPTRVVEDTPTFDAVLEPLNPQRLLMKPEGERAWKWWSIWAKKALAVGDVIIDSEDRYFRIVSSEDWNLGGYHRYEAVERPAS